MRWSNLAFCLAACQFFAAAGCGKSAIDAPREQKAAVLEPVATASGLPALVDIQGQIVWPPASDATKALAVVFVLPDCPICNAYLPELKRLGDEFASQGISLVLVHADTQVTAAEAKNHQREYQMTLPVALDPQRAWIRKAEAKIAPEVALFSPAGELLYRGRIDNQYAGLGQRRATVTSHDLRDACEAILAGQPVKEPRTEAIGCFIPHD